MPELEFKSKSVSYRVEHGSLGSYEALYISLRPDDDRKPIMGDNPLITLDRWQLSISSDAPEVDEFDLPDSVGRAKRLIKNIMSVSISLPPTRFNALTRAVLSGSQLIDISIEVDGLIESDEEFLWSNPDEPINISSISLSFSCAPSASPPTEA